MANSTKCVTERFRGIVARLDAWGVVCLGDGLALRG